MSNHSEEKPHSDLRDIDSSSDVDFLAFKVAEKAKEHVLKWAKWLGGAAAVVLIGLGIQFNSLINNADSRILSLVSEKVDKKINDKSADIDKRTQTMVDHQIEALVRTRTESEKAIQQLGTNAGSELQALRTKSAAFSKELAQLREQVTSESDKFFVAVRSGPPSNSSELEVIFGILPKNVYAIAGSANFGMGSDGTEGGNFTVAFGSALSDAKDTNQDDMISLNEIANAMAQRIKGPQKPVFGGADMTFPLRVTGNGQDEPNQKIHALLVGLNTVDPKKFSGWSGELEGPEKDVTSMKKLLESKSHLLRSSVAVTELRSKKATRDQIKEQIKSLVGRASKQDVIIFFFSGHGSQDVAVDTKKAVCSVIAYDGGMTVPEVVSLLKASEAHRVIIIIDA